MLKIGAIIYSRLSSTRFPRKALAALGEKRVVDWAIEGAKLFSDSTVILATSNKEEDKELVEVAKENKIRFFQGELNDVAKRTIDCCNEFELDYFFRINGDSPFLNIPLMEKALEKLSNQEFDLISNLVNRSYPYGMSCELIRVETFAKAYDYFDGHHKEHITSFYYTNDTQFNIGALPVLSQDYSKIRLTVDTKEDLEILNVWQKNKDPNALYFLNPKQFNKELEELKNRRND